MKIKFIFIVTFLVAGLFSQAAFSWPVFCKINDLPKKVVFSEIIDAEGSFNENNWKIIQDQWKKYVFDSGYPANSYAYESAFCYSPGYFGGNEEQVYQRRKDEIEGWAFNPSVYKVVNWKPNFSNQSVSKSKQSPANSEDFQQKRVQLSEKYGVQFSGLQSASDNSINEPSNNGKKRINIKNYAKQCIKPIDIKLQRDDNRIYWYKMQNKCAETLQVAWCDFNNGMPCTGSVFNSAWDIAGGKSYEAWAFIDPKSKQYHLRWTACQEKYEGKAVYVDHKEGGCYIWD